MTAVWLAAWIACDSAAWAGMREMRAVTGVAETAGRLVAPVAAAHGQAYAASVREVAPVDMKSSCAAEAAADVNRGAAFLLALAPADARRAFERAAGADPDCALAGWGRAMSWLPIDRWQLADQASREGRDAVRRAAGRGSARERAYVASVAHVFDGADAGEIPLPTRLLRYRDAMRDLAAAYPDDGVAAILFARATLLLSTVPDDEAQREAAAIVERRLGSTLERVIAAAGATGGPSAPATVNARGLSGTLPATDTSGMPRSAATADVPDWTLGAALTLLLARDRPTAAQLARPAADAVSRLATLPLARHLPARTYTRLGDWSAAAASTEAAIKLAGSAASPELIHGSTYAGAQQDVAAEWLVEAYLQQGRVAQASAIIELVRRALPAASAPTAHAAPQAADSDAVVLPRTAESLRTTAAADDPASAGDRVVHDSLSAALVRMQARLVLARADWTRGRDAKALACGDASSDSARALAAPALTAPAGAPSSTGGAGSTAVSAPSATAASAVCTFVQAYAAARLAWPGAKADPLAEAARLSDRLAGTGGARALAVPELLRVLVRAAIAAGQEEHPELEVLASYAIDLEERLQRSGQLVLPLAPASELLGDLFLQANRFEQARRHYRDALVASPHRARALLGIARASVRLDDRASATAAYRELLELWAHADPDLPELAEARKAVTP